MHGSTFHTSRTERERRRAAGPALVLVGGGNDSPAPSSVVPPAHPAFEGFTPDGHPGHTTRAAVHASGPESPSVRRSSRGSTSPGVGGTAHSGPGPHVPQADVVRRIADYLDEFDARHASPAQTAGLRRIR